MTKPGQFLSVQIEVFNNVDSHPSRNFKLEWPTYQIRVGRGSMSGGKELYPAEDNAWFESRVMSRAHAVLQTDPVTRMVYIEDVGSMHGTYIEDRKLVPHTRERLLTGDFIKFGAEVTRGPESFPPLEMCISFDWVDETPRPVPNAPTMSHAEISRNSFSVPEYDDDDDDEIEIVHESVRVPRVEVVVPSRPIYTVPESDQSCAGSFTSEDSSSEPPTPSPKAFRLVPANQKHLPETLNAMTEDMVGIQRLVRDRQAVLSDAPSAAGFFHFEGELLPTYNQPLSQTKPVIGRETGPGTTDSVKGAEGAMDDENLTESENESADGYSDDLFDEDGESIQQGSRAESPPPSEIDDSDEEPQPSNRGAKLPESTDDGQKLRLYEVDEAEHSSPQAANSKPAASSNVGLPLFDGLYSPNSMFDEQNLAQEHLKYVNEARAPSPSDAALAKTSTAPHPWVNDLKIPPGVPTPFVVPMTSDFPRPTTTQSPYPRQTWSTWQAYKADSPAEYPSYVYSPAISHSTYQDGPFGCKQSADPMKPDDSSERGDEESTACQPPTWMSPYQAVGSAEQQPAYPFTAPTVQDASQSSCALPNLGATRLSIEHIVDRDVQEATAPNGGEKLKRKANDISTDEDALATNIVIGDDEIISELGITPEPTESTQSAQSHIATKPNTDTESVPPIQTAEQIEPPPPKRAKVGVAKYAAAVFAGMVAGGVGTMAALLALPPIQLA